MVSVRPSIDGLSADVLACIIEELPFSDICSLRLVSQTLAVGSYQLFATHLTAKTLKWTSTQQLQEFVHFTQPNQPGCLLQHLTLVGVAASSILEHGSDSDVLFATSTKLLTNAFTNLRLNSGCGSLKSVVLKVQGENNNGSTIPFEKIRDYRSTWKAVWETAAQTFELTSCALAESALPVQKLDIFGSVTRCSLACDRVGNRDLSKSLEKLKSLTLSLSHGLAEDPQGDAIPKAHADNIAQLLHLCPQLENLELHWYDLRYYKKNEDPEEQQFFTYVVKGAQLSQLQRCRLDGIDTSETVLLAFLGKATQLSHLCINHMDLKPGSFGPVFNYLASHVQHLDHLQLDRLHEAKLICFDGPGQPHLPSGSPNGPNILTRTGKDCQRHIGYRPMFGRAKGSGEAWRWREQRSILYGPPDVTQTVIMKTDTRLFWLL
ncbi:hypothetical protein OIDMADRAFT_46528 [Oidiodendron maius Zn]|uniref:Uncharacterized protein n=1 Tax=Oidiodendron maius (strain Zn) TaxID=913774 RepID=A0A0C3C1Z0_OIDMZ|nr:hypothetical protein OIDMADRAFT_46528 [Oidiodendron maius Zn]